MQIKSFLVFLIVLNCSIQGASALSVVVHVPEKYTAVHAGERFYFEIEVKYPENPHRKDLRLEYEIRDMDGKLLAQSKVLKAIETQASFIDFIVIPEVADTGLHIINVKVTDYESLNKEVSASFHVTGESSENMTLYLLAILVAVILVTSLSIIQLIILRKKQGGGETS